jgi:hypothetical protein
LRDLGLIGCVGGVPARVLHHHAQDHAWRDCVVVAETDVGAEDLVAFRQTVQALEVMMLALAGGKPKRRAQADGGRNRLVDESSDAAPTASSMAPRSSADGPM